VNRKSLKADRWGGPYMARLPRLGQSPTGRTKRRGEGWGHYVFHAITRDMLRQAFKQDMCEQNR